MDKANQKFKVLVTDHLPPVGWDALNAADDVVVAGPFNEVRADLLDAVVDADAIIIRSATEANAELMAAGKNLKIIARAGAQVHNIDIEEATRRGIMVLNVPDANRYAIVEHTFGLILALARKIPDGVRSLQNGEWLRHKLVGFQLHGKTLGLIGFGGLGQELAARGQAFGMKVMAFDPYVDLYRAREQRVEIAEFEDVLKRADILTLQTALTSQTRHIMNADAFAQMKPEAYLVSGVQAGLIDEAALLEALDTGMIAGAALDTFIEEPVSPDNPLIKHEKVIATPHLNQNTIESQIATGVEVVSDVLDVLRDENYRNVINLPFTDKTTYQAAKHYIRLGTKLGMMQGQLTDEKVTRIEVELLGDGLGQFVRAATAGLLTGFHKKNGNHDLNWVSAPVATYEMGIQTAQVKNLLNLAGYPSLFACRIEWEGGGSRLIAGALHASGESRIIYYDGFILDAVPQGYVLILENKDVPGVIGRVGTNLGDASINIINWRYARESVGGRASSFISLDSAPSKELLENLESRPEINYARLVQF